MQVLKFTPTGQLLLSVGSALSPGAGGTRGALLCKPTRAVVAADGSFLVTDGLCSSRVLRFSPKVGRAAAAACTQRLPPNPPDARLAAHSSCGLASAGQAAGGGCAARGELLAEAALPASGGAVHHVLLDEAAGVAYVLLRESGVLSVRNATTLALLREAALSGATGLGRAWALLPDPAAPGRVYALLWDWGREPWLVDVDDVARRVALPGHDAQHMLPHDAVVGLGRVWEPGVGSLWEPGVGRVWEPGGADAVPSGGATAAGSEQQQLQQQQQHVLYVVPIGMPPVCGQLQRLLLTSVDEAADKSTAISLQTEQQVQPLASAPQPKQLLPQSLEQVEAGDVEGLPPLQQARQQIRQHEMQAREEMAMQEAQTPGTAGSGLLSPERRHGVRHEDDPAAAEIREQRRRRRRRARAPHAEAAERHDQGQQQEGL
eukprot:365614-Chlamydomonas_euryale.AAC.6